MDCINCAESDGSGNPGGSCCAQCQEEDAYIQAESVRRLYEPDNEGDER